MARLPPFEERAPIRAPFPHTGTAWVEGRSHNGAYRLSVYRLCGEARREFSASSSEDEADGYIGRPGQCPHTREFVSSLHFLTRVRWRTFLPGAPATSYSLARTSPPQAANV